VKISKSIKITKTITKITISKKVFHKCKEETKFLSKNKINKINKNNKKINKINKFKNINKMNNTFLHFNQFLEDRKMIVLIIIRIKWKEVHLER
jgi:hypothetical protein